MHPWRCERHQAEHSELYRELEIAEKMALPVADSPGEFCGLAFTNKQFGRFTERDRHMLMVLRPHLAAAYANAQQFSAIIAARTSGARVDLTPSEAEIACVRTVEKHAWNGSCGS